MVYYAQSGTWAATPPSNSKVVRHAQSGGQSLQKLVAGLQSAVDTIRAKDKQLDADAKKLKAAAATEDRMHVRLLLCLQPAALPPRWRHARV
jgi:hypothetical protein